MESQPTYKKFEAKSRQFAEVGKAMHDHWFHPTASTRYRRAFTQDDIDNFIQWMWHEARGLENIIFDKDREIEHLKKKLKDTTRSNDEITK